MMMKTTKATYNAQTLLMHELNHNIKCAIIENGVPRPVYDGDAMRDAAASSIAAQWEHFK